MTGTPLSSHGLETPRHRTAWLEAGPADGPLMILLHGWPEHSLVWRPQLSFFAEAGWRCVAPDMRGYGGSSAPTRVADYAVREVVADMVELHDALGGAPALWVGHDHGSMVAWAMAMHHGERCRGVVSLTVPHIARGIGLPTLVPLVNREIYPVDEFPVGQWDYMLFYAEHFTRAVRDFEVHLDQALGMLFSPGSSDAVGRPAPLAAIRVNGGWFPAGAADQSPSASDGLLPPADRAAIRDALARTGFSGPCAWYLNDVANLAFAAEAPEFGRLSLPVLFLHAEWDPVCDTAFGRLAEPMREDCSDLTEVRIPAGHMLMLEKPDEVNQAISHWVAERKLDAGAAAD